MASRLRTTTYMGRVIRVSERTDIRLKSIKDKRGYKNIDTVIDTALRRSGLLFHAQPMPMKSKPKKTTRNSFFSTEDFGI